MTMSKDILSASVKSDGMHSVVKREGERGCDCGGGEHISMSWKVLKT